MSKVIDLQEERIDRELKKVQTVLHKAIGCHVLTPDQVAMIDAFLEEFKDVVDIEVGQK